MINTDDTTEVIKYNENMGLVNRIDMQISFTTNATLKNF